MKTDKPVYVGVDLAKDTFDAAIATADSQPRDWAALSHRSFAIAHDDEAAARALAEWVRSEVGHTKVALVLVESTGALSTRFARVVDRWPVRIEDPRRIKTFAQSLGHRHKSDRVDAAMIALFAARRRPEVNTRRDAAEVELRRLTRLRQRYTRELTAWKNRLARADSATARRHIKISIRQVQHHIEQLEKEAQATITASPRLAKLTRDIQQIPGIKTVVAPVLIAELGDLAAYTRNGLSAAAGVYPAASQSGKTNKGSHLSKTGSKRARSMLHMAARSLFRSKGPLRDHIEHLKARGVSKSCILGIMMRKLLLIARAVARSNGVYDPAMIRFALS